MAVGAHPEGQAAEAAQAGRVPSAASRTWTSIIQCGSLSDLRFTAILKFRQLANETPFP